jgi:hypothetical protein
MAEFLIDKDVRISITSNVNAAFQQRFYIEKRYDKDPFGIWRQMGNHLYNGVHSIPINFLSDSEYSLWRIRCENQKDGDWRNSLENHTGGGTNKIVIYCDDDNSKGSDSDYNDLIVTVNLIYPNDSKLGEDFYEKFDKTANGPNGKTVNDSDKKHHLPKLDKKGNPIIEP